MISETNNIVILGDTHFGARNDSPIFLAYFEKFFEYLFDFMQANNIKTIIQLGDLFDKKKNINYYTLRMVKQFFFDQLIKRGITLIAFPGNHDLPLKNTTEVSSLNELFTAPAKLPDNIIWVTQPSVLKFGNLEGLFLPWICESNIEATIDLLENSTCPYVFGHLELAGFEMQRGQIMDKGTIDGNLFSKYKRVITGHFHTRNCKDNIYYVGTPYEMSWADYKDPKGFHVFDCTSNSLVFYENPPELRIFDKIYYDEDKLDKKFNFAQYANKFLKIVIVKKVKEKRYQQFIELLEQHHPHGIQIIDVPPNVAFSLLDYDVNKTEDLLDVIVNIVEQGDVQQKQEVIAELKLLYNQQKQVE